MGLCAARRPCLPTAAASKVCSRCVASIGGKECAPGGRPQPVCRGRCKIARTFDHLLWVWWAARQWPPLHSCAIAPCGRALCCTCLERQAAECVCAHGRPQRSLRALKSDLQRANSPGALQGSTELFVPLPIALVPDDGRSDPSSGRTLRVPLTPGERGGQGYLSMHPPSKVGFANRGRQCILASGTHSPCTEHQHLLQPLLPSLLPLLPLPPPLLGCRRRLHVHTAWMRCTWLLRCTKRGRCHSANQVRLRTVQGVHSGGRS